MYFIHTQTHNVYFHQEAHKTEKQNEMTLKGIHKISSLHVTS